MRFESLTYLVYTITDFLGGHTHTRARDVLSPVNEREIYFIFFFQARSKIHYNNYSRAAHKLSNCPFVLFSTAAPVADALSKISDRVYEKFLGKFRALYRRRWTRRRDNNM